MYDELIKNLRGMAKGFCAFDRSNAMCGYFVTKQAADAIEELTAINERQLLEIAVLSKPRWIPVTERLPEEDKSVLVCFDFKGRKSIDVAELWSDGRFHNYSDDYLTPEGRKYRRATHWMPLPEPPESEEI